MCQYIREHIVGYYIYALACLSLLELNEDMCLKNDSRLRESQRLASSISWPACKYASSLQELTDPKTYTVIHYTLTLKVSS